MKMFKMSKFLVFILSCILLVSIIAGCGNSAEETVSNTPTPSQGILDETKDNEEENSEIENVKPEATFKRDTYYLGLDLSGMTYKEALEAVKGLTRNYCEELDKFSFTVKADDETTLTIKGSDLEFTDKTEVKLAELIVHEKNGNTKMAAEFDKKIIKITFPDMNNIKNSFFITSQSIDDMIKEGYEHAHKILSKAFANGYEDKEFVLARIKKVNSRAENPKLRLTTDVVITNVNKALSLFAKRKITY